jgi:hypothetical protein
MARRSSPGILNMIPNKKISLTLIEYAEPLIDDLEDGYSKSDLERILKFTAGIWNACVLDQWRGTTEHVEAIRRQIAKAAHPMPIALVEAMIARKQQLFGNDPRGIANECVIVKNGELAVRAEARLDLQHLPVEDKYAN